MRNNIVLIDFENLQPESLEQLSQDRFRVVVFIGAEQKKIPTSSPRTPARVEDIGDMPLIKFVGAKSLEERVQIVIDKLAHWKAKPATVERLANSITTLFQKQLRDEEVNAVVEGLKKRGVISVDGTSKVTYAGASGA